MCVILYAYRRKYTSIILKNWKLIIYLMLFTVRFVPHRSTGPTVCQSTPSYLSRMITYNVIRKSAWVWFFDIYTYMIINNTRSNLIEMKTKEACLCSRNFCGKIWHFINKASLIVCLFLLMRWRSRYQDGQGKNPINRIVPATFVC